ncbi:hypothetical protein QE152_g32142 [Popillia japonica]|uniref:Uncharacterized protein n=1 Tax=Popillia japonica TaxID=7064 RepID=A0AAW1J0G1_POPJA
MTDQYCFAIAQANPRTMADLVALCAKWMDLFERRKPAAKPSGAAVPAGPPKTATMADLVALCAKWMDLFERRKPAAKPSGAAVPAGPPKTAGPPRTAGPTKYHLEPEGQPPRPPGQTIKRPDAHQNVGSAQDTISTEIVRSSLVGSKTANQAQKTKSGKE